MANENYISGNSNYAYGNYHYGSGNQTYYGSGNGAYYGDKQYNHYNNYGGPQGNNMLKGQGGEDDEESMGGFDIMEWILRVVHYWWMLAIGVVIAFACAWLTNRKWVPQYYSQGTVIIKENMGYGGAGAANSVLMQGFGVDAGYKNVNNQVIMLGSYDLMCRVVDSLPFFNVEYVTQGRFKSRNLYKNTPILLETTKVDGRAYGQLFQLSFAKDGSMHIESTDENQNLSFWVHYGEPFDCAFFSGTIWPTEQMINSGKIYFRFRSHESLVDEFMTRLKLDFVTQGSTVLALALVSETPERDCDFINKLAEIYLLQNLERKNEVAVSSIRFIDEQLGQLSTSLSKSENAMTDFRQENKFIDVSAYANQVLARLASYDDEELNFRLTETYYDYLTNYVNSHIESGAVIAPSTLGLEEPTLSALVQQLNELRIQRGELTEKNVYYAKYSKDIQNVETSIAEVVKQMRANLDIQEADMRRRRQEVEQDLLKLPEKELQMVSIERSYRIDDNYYTFFLQKRAEAEIQKASNTPDNTILDKARTTAVMNGGSKKKTTTTYMMIGMLIPLLIIVLSELLNNKIRTPKELAKMSQFHLIGTLRHVKSQNPTLVKDHPRSTYSEMLRAIRNRIEFITRRKDKFVFCVTSTESGDGKTFLSTNFATLYAQTGKKTLLIDLDIRKPNIHTKLGLENGKGISNYLADDCTLEEAMIRNTPFKFDFMRAGSIPPNPGELIHSEKMMNLLKKFREEYDYIIIDTSPVGLVPDAYSLMEHVDLCMFVVRCLETNKTFAKETLAQLSEIVDDMSKVQLVLSDIPSSGFHKGFHYGKGYGYGYGYGGGYGYGYGYGYGTGTYSKYRKKYGRYYERYFRRSTDSEEKRKHYYSDDEDDKV